jgi:hypothetical protein
MRRPTGGRMAVVGKVVLGRRATTVVDLFDHY